MERKNDQVYGRLTQVIVNGILFPGSRLPAEKELSRSFEVEQGALRRAQVRLETEGLVERIRSRGTYVTEYCNAALEICPRKHFSPFFPQNRAGNLSGYTVSRLSKVKNEPMFLR